METPSSSLHDKATAPPPMKIKTTLLFPQARLWEIEEEQEKRKDQHKNIRKSDKTNKTEASTSITSPSEIKNETSLFSRSPNKTDEDKTVHSEQQTETRKTTSKSLNHRTQKRKKRFRSTSHWEQKKAKVDEIVHADIAEKMTALQLQSSSILSALGKRDEPFYSSEQHQHYSPASVTTDTSTNHDIPSSGDTQLQRKTNDANNSEDSRAPMTPARKSPRQQSPLPINTTTADHPASDIISPVTRSAATCDSELPDLTQSPKRCSDATLPMHSDLPVTDNLDSSVAVDSAEAESSKSLVDIQESMPVIINSYSLAGKQPDLPVNVKLPSSLGMNPQDTASIWDNQHDFSHLSSSTRENSTSPRQDIGVILYDETLPTGVLDLSKTSKTMYIRQAGRSNSPLPTHSQVTGMSYEHYQHSQWPNTSVQHHVQEELERSRHPWYPVPSTSEHITDKNQIIGFTDHSNQLWNPVSQAEVQADISRKGTIQAEQETKDPDLQYIRTVSANPPQQYFNPAQPTHQTVQPIHLNQPVTHKPPHQPPQHRSQPLQSCMLPVPPTELPTFFPNVQMQTMIYNPISQVTRPGGPFDGNFNMPNEHTPTSQASQTLHFRNSWHQPHESEYRTENPPRQPRQATDQQFGKVYSETSKEAFAQKVSQSNAEPPKCSPDPSTQWLNTPPPSQPREEYPGSRLSKFSSLPPREISLQQERASPTLTGKEQPAPVLQQVPSQPRRRTLHEPQRTSDNDPQYLGEVSYIQQREFPVQPERNFSSLPSREFSTRPNMELSVVRNSGPPFETRKYTNTHFTGYPDIHTGQFHPQYPGYPAMQTNVSSQAPYPQYPVLPSNRLQEEYPVTPGHPPYPRFPGYHTNLGRPLAPSVGYPEMYTNQARVQSATPAIAPSTWQHKTSIRQHPPISEPTARVRQVTRPKQSKKRSSYFVFEKTY